MLKLCCFFHLLILGTGLSFENNCSTYDRSKGIIDSEDQDGRTCVWRFNADLLDTFVLRFLDYTSLSQLFTLCQSSYLEVKDGTVADSPSIVGPKMCYIIENSAEVYTKSNGLWVKTVTASFSFDKLKAEVRIDSSKSKWYKLHTDEVTWMEARDRCLTDDGRLAVSYPAPTLALEQIALDSTVSVWTGKSVTDWVWLLGCVKLMNKAGIQEAYKHSKYNQISECATACRGSKFLLIQGKNCYCYKDLIAVEKVEFQECNVSCPGNNMEKCGGLNTYTHYQFRKSSLPVSRDKFWSRNCAALSESVRYTAMSCDVRLPFSCNFKNETETRTETYTVALPWHEAVQFCSQQAGSFGLSTIPKLSAAFFSEAMWLGLVRGIDWDYPSVNRRHPGKAFTAVKGSIRRVTTYMEQLTNTSSKHQYVCQYEKPNCGGNLTTSMDGNITSPNYPDPYDVGKHCVFTISAEPGLVFIIEFQHFDLEHSVDCIYDYLQITEIVNENVKAVAQRLCGQQNPESFVAHTNHIEVVFKSDRSMTATGFMLSWRQVNDAEARKWEEGKKPQKINAGVIVGVTIATTFIVIIILCIVFIAKRARRKRLGIIQDPIASSVNNGIYGMEESEFEETSVANDNFRQYENVNSPKKLNLTEEESYSYENVAGCSLAIGVTTPDNRKGSKANLLLGSNEEGDNDQEKPSKNTKVRKTKMESVSDDKTDGMAIEGAVLSMADVENMGKDSIQIVETSDRAGYNTDNVDDDDYIPIEPDMTKRIVENKHDDKLKSPYKNDGIVEGDSNVYQNARKEEIDEDGVYVEGDYPDDYENMPSTPGHSRLLTSGNNTHEPLGSQASNWYAEVEEMNQLKK